MVNWSQIATGSVVSRNRGTISSQSVTVCNGLQKRFCLTDNSSHTPFLRFKCDNITVFEKLKYRMDFTFVLTGRG